MKKHIHTFGPRFASTQLSKKTAIIRRIACLLPAFAGGLWLASAQPVGAYPSMAGTEAEATDGAYVALREFARDAGIETAAAPQLAQASTQDGAYSALLDFAQMVGVDAPKTVAGEAPANAAAPATAATSAKPAKPAPVKHVAVKPRKAAKPFKENKGGEGDAYFVGSAKCMTCHAEIAAQFSKTLMGRIGRTTRKGAFECENCHGPGSKHVAAGGGRGVGGLMSFRPDDPRFTVAQINEVCLNCHEKGDRTAWKGSTHETRGLACTNCHTIMRQITPKFQLAKETEMEVCFQCHKDRRAQLFRSSHMPLREGKITCSDCHNPHGSIYGTEAMLRGESVNDVCYKCHAEKRGPFLFEHEPVRENCDNCHEPHGSVYEAMLKAPRPRLCTECHGFGHGGLFTAGPGSQFAISRSCQNCHTDVHGSNSPAGVLMHR